MNLKVFAREDTFKIPAVVIFIKMFSIFILVLHIAIGADTP